MFRTEKLSENWELPDLGRYNRKIRQRFTFGYPKAYNVEICGLILVSVQAPKLVFSTISPLQNRKVLFDFERKNRDESKQWHT